MNHPIELASTLIIILCGLLFGSIVTSVGNVRQSFPEGGRPENLAIEAGERGRGHPTLAAIPECPPEGQISALSSKPESLPENGKPGGGKTGEKAGRRCGPSEASPEEAARMIEERIDNIEVKLERLLDRIEKIEPKAM